MLDSPFIFSETQAQVISCYSQIKGVLELNSTAALRQFTGAPPVGTNLLSNAQGDMDSSPVARRLDPIVESCLESSEAKQALLQAQVVTTRGALRSISCPQARCEFFVSFIDGRLFIEQREIRKTVYLRPEGFAFERECTERYNTCTAGAYYSIMARRFGKLNVVFAGEVDCVTDLPSSGMPQPSSFLELKTRSTNKNPRWIARDNQRFYMQSYLIGCPNIFFRLRSDDGILEETKMTAIEDLNTQSDPNEPPFLPADAMKRITQILHYVQRKVSKDYDPSRRVQVWRLNIFPVAERKRDNIRPVSRQELRNIKATENWGEPRMGIITSRVVQLMRRG